MSAPDAKHGNPSHEQLVDVADQLAECGIHRVGLTGGEPLVRDDFLQIVDELCVRDIRISMVYTNGMLVDERLLDGLAARGVRPSFQVSFDGLGWHDWLRGVDGVEKRTLAAIELLAKRGHSVSVPICLHRHNVPAVIPTVARLAGLGVEHVRVGGMFELGNWTGEDLAEARLREDEFHEAAGRIAVDYFAAGAPVALSIGGDFSYKLGDEAWSISVREKCAPGEADRTPSCPLLTKICYIGADGAVAPCQGMADTILGPELLNVWKTPLRDILRDPGFTELCRATVGDVRRANEKCRGCDHFERCGGGCREAALVADGAYLGIDPNLCSYFKGGWEQRHREVIQPAFEAYREHAGL